MREPSKPDMKCEAEKAMSVWQCCRMKRLRHIFVSFPNFTIPPEAGIGTHTHSGETEYFFIIEGNATVNDNGVTTIVHPGDVLITGGGALHNIENHTAEPVRLVAVIVTEA